MEVNEDVLSEFVCPVCREIMAAPIRMCSEGHSYCNGCYEQVSLCPLCRSEQDGTRNYIMEEFGRHILFNCSNHLDGCEFKGGVEKVKAHVTHCRYTFTTCPLRCLKFCTWFGAYQDVMEHCLKVHPNNTFRRNRQRLKCEKFVACHDKNVLHLKHFYLLVEAYGELFQWSWDMNCSTGFMMWRVTYLGPAENASQFTFSVQFADAADALTVKGTCQPMCLSELPTANMYVSTNKKSLVKYCVGGDLYYTIAIHKPRDGCDSEMKSEPLSSLYTPEPCICRFDK